MPLRASKIVSKRLQARAPLALAFDDVQPTTLARYNRMLAMFAQLLLLSDSVTLKVLVAEGAFAAIQLWSLLLLQIGYDSGVLGLGDVGNFLSALTRELRLLGLSGASTFVTPDSLMKPLWKVLTHWKKVEPYEYRVPLPHRVVLSLMGFCMAHGDWTLLLFISITYHCWLRPGETLALLACDVCLESMLEVPGIVRVRNPKIKVPRHQHVVVESQAIARLWKLVIAQISRAPQAPLFPWSVLHLHKKWVSLMVSMQLHQVVPLDSSITSRFTAAGLRSSGATRDFLLKESLDRVLWRGRWASLPVLKHYLQLGVYHLGSLQLVGPVCATVDHYADLFVRFMEAI